MTELIAHNKVQSVLLGAMAASIGAIFYAGVVTGDVKQNSEDIKDNNTAIIKLQDSVEHRLDSIEKEQAGINANLQIMNQTQTRILNLLEKKYGN